MQKISTQSTSRHSAVCSEIVIREGSQIRLVFRPEIVDNPTDPAACVRGRFVYQRKGKQDSWTDIATKPLSSLKKGDAFQLEIRASELLSLLRNLGALYRVHWNEGVPQGRVEFLRVEEHLAKLLQLSEPELNDFLSSNSADAIKTLRRVLKWLADRPATREQLASNETDLPELNALVGLANLKSLLNVWNDNSGNSEEEFWQNVFAKHAFVLSQLFSYPVVVIGEKAYVGGKRITNLHGNLVDFLCQVETSRAAVLVEIKTPKTPLLGSAYRQDVFPPSRDLGGSISQVLGYRESLMQEIHTLTQGQSISISAAEPRCVVIAGCASTEFQNENQARSFERIRERLMGVTVVTFDEVFARVKSLIELFERAEPL